MASDDKSGRSISAVIPTPKPEDVIRDLQSLVEKHDINQEEILQLVTKAYLLALEDCRSYHSGFYRHHHESIYKRGLRKIYDRIKPNHDLTFSY